MMDLTDTITITRWDFRRAVARCAALFRDIGLEQKEFDPKRVKLYTTAVVGFCSGLETELFKDTDKSDESIRQQ